MPTCSEQISAAHRADAQRRIDADRFGPRYLPPPGSRRAHVVPRWRSLANYAIVIDEAHSSQTGEAAKELRLALGAGEEQELTGLRG
ncbi:MAG: hypothetical protein WBP81_23000 [Solirubrobacteraceae bacterium]